jgi:hypothetical protein
MTLAKEFRKIIHPEISGQEKTPAATKPPEENSQFDGKHRSSDALATE